MSEDILNQIWPEWKIIKVLGRGSYGVVYEAERTDDLLSVHSAIKMINIPTDDSEVELLRSEGMTEPETRTYYRDIVNGFVDEIRVMESFKGHNNIVSIEDYKVVEWKERVAWTILIRMELLTPFNDYISDKKLSEEEVVSLGLDICSALELCEKKNIIHRDIKPENLFINQFGNFKLGDFGVARTLENITSTLSIKGTYSYMAPEVEKRQPYSANVDLYSLGLVLYRLMNKNRLPFLDVDKQILSMEERTEAALRRLRGDQLPAPCMASPELAKIILKACEPNPKKRYQQASEMKQDLLKLKNPNKQQKHVSAGTKRVVCLIIIAALLALIITISKLNRTEKTENQADNGGISSTQTEQIDDASVQKENDYSSSITSSQSANDHEDINSTVYTVDASEENSTHNEDAEIAAETVPSTGSEQDITDSETISTEESSADKELSETPSKTDSQEEETSNNKSATVLYVTRTGKNIRKEATSYSDLLRTVMDPDIPMYFYGVEKEGLSGDKNYTWYQVTFEDGLTGWIRSDYVTTELQEYEILYISDESADIKSEPSYDSDTVMTIDNTAFFFYYGQNSDGPFSDGTIHEWYRVYFPDGNRGWIPAEKITQ